MPLLPPADHSDGLDGGSEGEELDEQDAVVDGEIDDLEEDDDDLDSMGMPVIDVHGGDPEAGVHGGRMVGGEGRAPT